MIPMDITCMLMRKQIMTELASQSSFTILAGKYKNTITRLGLKA